jgi:putative peptide zinc metalloprotease protein
MEKTGWVSATDGSGEHARKEQAVTAVAGHVTSGRIASAPSTAGPTWPPPLADGVELLGEFKDSGYSRPPSLVRRADGQVIQMSPLLYRVASRIDGSQGADAIATLVSTDLGRSLNAEQVRYLITAKLLPLGVVAAGDAAGALPKANPLFSLRARGTLLPEPAVNLVGAFLRPLFRWPVVVAVVGGVLAMDYWLFAVHGLGGGIEQVLYISARLARRVATLARRWSAGRRARRVLTAAVILACLTTLAGFWTGQGQFQGW